MQIRSMCWVWEGETGFKIICLNIYICTHTHKDLHLKLCVQIYVFVYKHELPIWKTDYVRIKRSSVLTFGFHKSIRFCLFIVCFYFWKNHSSWDPSYRQYKVVYSKEIKGIFVRIRAVGSGPLYSELTALYLVSKKNFSFTRCLCACIYTCINYLSANCQNVSKLLPGLQSIYIP